MSLNYARELLKISISQLCDAIGFDTTSEIAIDILIDVCERQFLSLAKQTSNIIQLNNYSNQYFFHLLSILIDNNQEYLNNLQEYMLQFRSLPFSQDIIQFPYKKRNQFYLRIPPKHSQEIIQRDQNQSTDYIYDWLPLFPDQETPEQSTSINIDTNFDAIIYHDQQKKIDKSDSHHPLTLLSFLSKNGDETTTMPVGRRANQSLPSVLYRPRRVIEMEAAAAAAAAEKAKKEQLEKENNEKEQQQGPPPPLRLTIPKPLVVNDKPPLSIKKFPPQPSQTVPSTRTTTPPPLSLVPPPTPPLPTTTDGTVIKKPLSASVLVPNSPSINLGKKLIVSPPINQSNEIHSQSHPLINFSEISSNIDKNNDTVLDLSTKPILPSPIPTPTPTPQPTAAKVPRLKLNIKNVPNTQITTNSETPPTATKKFQRPTTSTKPLGNTHEKVNLKIRTSSLPIFGTNEAIPIISPPINIQNEIRTNSIESSSINLNKLINDNKQRTDLIHTNIRIDQPSTSTLISSQNESNEDENKKKKKKKHHHNQDDKQDKKIKKAQENNFNEQKNMKMDIDTIQSSTNPPIINPSSGGAIRLKIKLGKPSSSTNSLQTNKSDDQFNLTNSNDNEQRLHTELKSSPIRLTLPVASSINCPISSPVQIRPPIISTINRTPHRRKSGKIKRVPPKTEINEINDINSTSNIYLNEDNTVSIDDLPLGERTSPNKPILNNNQNNLSQPIILTPIKKKQNTNKKKSISKRTNNTVGVAVIEERRIDHDSQEKIWICPSCNRPDNGQEAMIACDLCDDWYHWECVGIVEEPPESIPWFCPKCHRSNSSTASAQGIKPSASSKAKRKRASALYQQKQQQHQHQQQQFT
ncbi:unnamed protein product [Rotaria sordida]|uniref:PHD-type domain-containing protein n=2 Tax=Rotaria sordida TaxID=392033 RepID=A0A813T3C0_9BILA|nr:unnamed protein product [Rotaria sordida]